MAHPVRTAHRQFGSKSRVAVELVSLVPTDVTVWVEGFAGTAALTLAKAPHPIEHLNDLNGDAVNLFDVMRDDAALERLVRLIEFTPWAEEEYLRARDHIYQAVTEADDDGDPVERARKFLVASWQSIGGKQRHHAAWRAQVASRNRNAFTITWAGVPLRLLRVAQRLKGVHIHRKHIRDLVAMFAREPAAVLFLDPPYPLFSINGHERMYAVDMTAEEHRALAEQLLGVKCKVLLTMAPGTVYSEVLAGWNVTPYQVRGLRNTVKEELALTNYRPLVPLPDLLHKLEAPRRRRVRGDLPLHQGSGAKLEAQTEES